MYFQEFSIDELTVRTIIGNNKAIGAGDEYYVDATNGSNGNNGKSAKEAKATLAAGYALLEAGQNDTLYLIGGTGTLSVAADLAWAKSNTSLIGMARDGSLLSANTMPTITMTADVNIDVSAADVTFANIKFINSFADLTSLIDLTAARFTMANCHFYGDAADTDTNIALITTVAANDLTIVGCSFNFVTATDGTTAITATATEAIRLVGADKAVIKDCYFEGDFTTSVINGISTASKDIKIIGNRIRNIATENIAGGIDLVVSCTGFIDGNLVFVAYSAANTGLIDASSCVLGLNYVSNVAGEVPVLHGTLEGGSIEAQISVIDSELSTVDSKVDSVGGQATTIDNELSVVDSEISIIESEVDSVGTLAGSKTDSVGTILSVVDSELSVVDSEISVVDSEISVIDSEIAVIASKQTSTNTLNSTQYSTIISKLDSLPGT